MQDARSHAEQAATAQLDAWVAQLMQRVDHDFLPWYFSYWNQQVLGLKGLWYWTLDRLLEAEPSATAKITAELQTELATRVLRPPVAQLELERIARHVVHVYVQELARQLEVIPKQYQIPTAAWDRHLADLAVLTSGVEGNRQVALSLKAVTATGSGGAVLLTRQFSSVTGKVGSKIAATFAGKTAAKVATASGVKIAAQTGGKLLGPIIGFGIIAWDVWDHQRTKAMNQPLLRQTIADYLAAVQDSLLHDPEAGVMTVIGIMEENVLASLT
jgi:hypothetical protein